MSKDLNIEACLEEVLTFMNQTIVALEQQNKLIVDLQERVKVLESQHPGFPMFSLSRIRTPKF